MHAAQLVHITPEAESLVAYMARVSNPSNQDNPESKRLIRYLIDHRHWSPFEMVNMCVEIRTTRSIAAQILRHRSFSFQEFSTRYAEIKDKPCPPSLREQDTKNRQNSTDTLDSGLVELYQFRVGSALNEAYLLYESMLRDGVAKECARDVLPLCTPTRMYMNGTLRSWLHYCDLRCGNGTQLEHRKVAESIKQILRDQTPTIYEAMWSNV
jgi:thymidylate synthase (FAD)